VRPGGGGKVGSKRESDWEGGWGEVEGSCGGRRWWTGGGSRGRGGGWGREKGRSGMREEEVEVYRRRSE